MGKRRLLFYNDARHTYMYCYDPPMRLEDARAPIDEVAGTGVDTFVYGFGAGPTMFHDTQVGETWGQRMDTQPNLHSWRAYENVKSLIDRGLDPLNVLIDRAHEKDLEFFASLRTSHNISPEEVENEFNWQFRVDHPEWCLKGSGRYCFNWVYPEVRSERFALIEETVNRYDIDGFEVDWVFRPDYFEDGEIEQNTPVLTQYMSDVRQVVDRAAERRGRPIALGARVLPTEAGNLAVGMDVAAWLRGGLLDFVVPNFYIDQQVDSDFPFEWLVELARGTRCEVYPALQSRVEDPAERPANLDQWRAGASAYWSKGADALYLPWFAWPVEEGERRILSEIQDAERMKDRPKHYAVRRQNEDAARRGYGAALPMTLTTGLDAPGQTVPLYVADEPGRARATLRLQITESTSHDSMTVSVNGTALAPETAWRTVHGFSYVWIEHSLPAGLLKKGRNEVGVALHSRPDNLDGVAVLDGVGAKVDYPEPQAVER